MSTFVTVGNATQPFPRLLDAVARAARRLPQPVTVQFGNNAFECDACTCVDFLDMGSFAAHIKQAELLIVHGGAGTVINAIQAGKVPLVAPRRACYGEHIDDHQVEFARALAKNGKVVVVEDMALLLGAVDEVRLRHVGHQVPADAPPLISMIRTTLRELAMGVDG